MGKKGGTARDSKTAKSDKARRLNADLPVKDVAAAAVKGGNDLGPDNRQKKHIASTTTSTSA